MKHSIVLKFLAILLAACSLVAAAASAAGIFLLGEDGLYNTTIAELETERQEAASRNLAYGLVRQYAFQNLGNCPEELLESLYYRGYYGYYNEFEEDSWFYTIVDDTGRVLESTYEHQPGITTYLYSGITTVYPTIVDYYTNPEYPAPPAEDEVAPTIPTIFPAEPSPAVYDEVCSWYDEETGEEIIYYLRYCQSPAYSVTIYLLPGAYSTDSSEEWQALTMLYPYRYTCIAALVLGLLLFAACMVYLCWAAGRKPGTDEIRPGGLNRLPLDLYAVGICLAGLLLDYPLTSLFNWTFYDGINWGGFTLVIMIALAACIVAIGFLFALAAQIKAKHGFWWRHSVIGFLLIRVWRVLRWIGKGICRLFSMLPLIWQWLLIAIAMLVSIFFALAIVYYSRFVLPFLSVLILCIAIVCYGAYAFGTLLAGAKRMAGGDLNAKIRTTYLIGSFADCANYLNALADVAVVAARQQLKSERMKTELITNVSHDIKTPLTSIINYVDLLQKPHTEADGEKYLEVLGRQSQRMKKLIEDLMEMSKATTGNLAVDITLVDAAEAVNQALGEFSDKLDAARLTTVFNPPAEPVAMQADGRLAWRVLSNLLSNAVKYALPGTRLYIDLVKLDGQVLISLKNISREQLNVNPDELMERFVRGDTSRNTEGSGLGLNIAKSLMELQHGQLQLLVDGDLFKVTLVFPAG